MSERLRQARELLNEAVKVDPVNPLYLASSLHQVLNHLEAQQSQVPPHRHPQYAGKPYRTGLPLGTRQSGPTSSAPTAGRASP